MNCRERENLIILYALGDLDPEEAQEVRAHLGSGCPVCAGTLAEAEAMLGQMALAVSPITPPAGVRQKLMARVAAPQATQTSQTDATGPSEPLATRLVREEAAPIPATSRRVGPWVPVIRLGYAAAFAAMVLITAGEYSQAQRQKRELESLQIGLTIAQNRMHKIEDLFAANTQVMELLRSPQLKLVSLSGGDAKSPATGRIFWDQHNHVWQFFADGLGALGKGKTYELWFITSGEKKVRAGTFDVDGRGEGELRVQVPKDIGPLALAAVTDEPEGGVDQPTGQIRLAGKIE